PSTPRGRCTPPRAPASASRTISMRRRAVSRSARRLRSFANRGLCAAVLVFGWWLIVGGWWPVLGANHQPPTTNHQLLRIITLAPNLTEIVFAIGAGDRIVATDDFSDSPAAAKKLPKVG